MFHPFNSARLVRLWLQHCELIAANTRDLAQRFDSVELEERPGILFPGDDAPLLSDLAPTERPTQLILPDGTWHHVKTLLREIPRLKTLPRYRLAPTKPGQYRIRREPNLQALSTLEATVQALESLEPETPGLDRMTNAFERMICSQIEVQPASVLSSSRSANRDDKAKTTNIPHLLRGELDNLVVATGEADAGPSEARASTERLPLYWTAFRLVEGSAFECVIDSDALSNSKLQQQLGIADDQLRSCVSLSEFRLRWEQFLRPTDRLVVFHPNIAQLLQNANASVPPCVALRSIDLPRVKAVIDKNADLSQLPTDLQNGTRASLRLANLVSMIDDIRRDVVLGSCKNSLTAGER